MTTTGCLPKASHTSVNPFSKVETVTMPNGLEVLFYENHASPVVSVHFWCRTGSRNEPLEYGGISHFFEHMFFKGSKHYGVGEMDRLIKSLGGYNNAFTSIEYTGYYVVLPAGQFPRAFDVLLDAVRAPNFDPHEIGLEREVVREEINRKHDNPTGALYEKFQSLIFAGTPLAPPVLGTYESVGRIDQKAFKTYLKSFYQPNNLCLIVAGDFDRKDVEGQIRKGVANWQVEENLPLPRIPAEQKLRTQPERFSMTKDVNQVSAVMGYAYGGYSDAKENLALDMASTLLSGGASSRLHKRLYIKEGIVQGVSAWVWPQEKMGAFGVEFTCPPENVERVKTEIHEELQRAINEPWVKGELDKVKNQMIAGFEMGHETGTDVARSLGEAWVFNRLPALATYIEDIQKMSEAEIKAALKQVVQPQALVYAEVVPK